MWTNARANQTPPKDPWHIWLILAGRGFGKTKTGSETVNHLIQNENYRRIGLIGHTINDVFSIMIEGVSGLLSCEQTGNPTIYRNRRMLEWPNGAIAQIYGADFYEKLRGPQFDLIWIDELAKFKYPSELWFQVMMTLRLGKSPKCIVTTTPKPIPLLKKLTNDQKINVTYGSTFENAANLSPLFLKTIEEEYKGTRN